MVGFTHTTTTHQLLTQIRDASFHVPFLTNNAPGVSVISKYGRCTGIAIADGAVDIWNGSPTNPVYTGFNATAAETLSVVSSSSNDTSAGTGARTVRLEGLDGNFSEIFEDVTLNGTTPVLTTQSFIRMPRAYVLTAGSGGQNAGSITARQSTTTANIMMVMPAAFNNTAICAYTIPAGKRGYVIHFEAGMGSTSGSGSGAEVTLRAREPGGVFRSRRIYGVLQESPLLIDIHSIVYPERTDIKVTSEGVLTNGSVIWGEFTVVLEDVV